MENTGINVDDLLYKDTAQRVVGALLNIWGVLICVDKFLGPKICSVLQNIPPVKAHITDNDFKSSLPYYLQECRKLYVMEEDLVLFEKMALLTTYESFLLVTPRWIVSSVGDKDLLMQKYVKPLLQSFEELCKIDPGTHAYSGTKEYFMNGLTQLYKKLEQLTLVS